MIPTPPFVLRGIRNSDSTDTRRGDAASEGSSGWIGFSGSVTRNCLRFLVGMISKTVNTTEALISVATPTPQGRRTPIPDVMFPTSQRPDESQTDFRKEPGFSSEYGVMHVNDTLVVFDADDRTQIKGPAVDVEEYR